MVCAAELMHRSLVCVCSEYLEVHQTELDKLTTQLKDMKRNSRLVRAMLCHCHCVGAQWPS